MEQDVEQYKKTLERNRTQYKITEQTVQPDGSIIIKVIKQYNSSPVGEYLNGMEKTGEIRSQAKTE